MTRFPTSSQIKGYIPVSFILNYLDKLQANSQAILHWFILIDQSESGFHNTGNKIFQRVLIWTLPVERCHNELQRDVTK